MVATVNLMRLGYSTIPFWDEMDEVDRYIDSIQRSPFGWIWAQHNEHRIVFYKLLLIVDMQFFAGRNWPMYVGVFCFQLSLVVIFGYILWKVGHLTPPLWEACVGIALYCLFCPSQWENLFWAFQLSFMMVNVWVAIAILCVSLQKQRTQAGQPAGGTLLLVSLLAAAAATFTNGNGVTVWPVLIVIALVARLPWRVIITYVAGLCCIVPIYLVGYHSPPQHADVLASIRHPWSILAFVENYLGSAPVDNAHIGWAVYAGRLALILVVILAFQLLRHRGRANALDYALAGIVLYCVATAFITALGRLNFGIGQAYTPRYQTFSLLFWWALTTWILVALSRRGAVKSTVALYVVIATILCASAFHYRPILDIVRDRILQREVGGIAMVTGVHDEELLRTAILPFPVTHLDYLQAHHLSLFSTSTAEQLGQAFGQKYTIMPSNTCAGYVDVVSNPDPSPQDVKLQGWIIDRRTRWPVSTLLLVAEDKIVGLGISGEQRPDVVNAIRSKRALRSGWIAYAKLPDATRQLDVYGVMNISKGTELCHLQTIQVPNSTR